MIGILLVTHGRLGSELLVVAQQILGDLTHVEAVDIQPDNDLDECTLWIEAALARCEAGKGVLILTDLFGGTPSNLAVHHLQEGKVEVLAGVNLPMLVKVARMREDTDLRTLAETGLEAARSYINIASDILAEE